MTKKIVCDTYHIPTWEADQLIEAWGDDVSRACEAAIDICRDERARLYCTPAHWEAFHNADGSMTVKRYRYKREVIHA